MRGQALVAAAAMAAALAASPQASARDYYSNGGYEAQRCEQMRDSRTAAGAVVGGILGAVVGSNVAAGNARTEGSVLGGVVGAVAGGAIGRNSSDCDRDRHDQYGYDQRGEYRGQTPHRDGYRDEDLLGGPRPAAYRGARQGCGYQDVIVGRGRNRHVEQVWTCDAPQRGAYGRY